MSTHRVSASGLAVRVKQGLAWSLISNVVLRLSGLLIGVLLARILSPQAFGIYAVGLTAQTILQTLAELGLSADLIRHGDVARRAPTVASIGLGASILLASFTCLFAEPVALLLGDAAGAPIIRVLSITLVLSGCAAVPFAIAQREFMQKQQFAADAGGLLITTATTLALVALGFGPLALAWSRVAGQTYTTVVQFKFTRTVPKYGFDFTVAKSSLRFGTPLAAANLLSWLLLNVDYIVIGNQGRATALGFYVLAFNLSSWPSTALGNALRTVTFPAFAELADKGFLLRRAVVATTELAWAAALPIGSSLMVLATPFISVVYGNKWATSGGPLLGLAGFGILRVVFDVMASFLIAKGESRQILWIQILWLFSLAPTVWFGMEWYGITGVGWAHLIVALAFIYPSYLWIMRKHGFSIKELTLGTAWPVAATAFSAPLAFMVSQMFNNDLLALLAGGTVGLATYGALTFRWMTRRLKTLKGHAGDPVTDNPPPQGNQSPSAVKNSSTPALMDVKHAIKQTSPEGTAI